MSLPRLQHIEAQDPKLPIFQKKTLNMLYLAAVLSFITVLIVPLAGIIFSVFACGWVVLNTQIRLYHKAQIENFHHYRQTEALLNLHDLITIRQPLPHMRLWVISPDFATLLVSIMKQYQPKTIVELGSGTSTLIEAYVLEDLSNGGKIISFEHLEDFAEITRQTLKQHQLNQYATVIYAPLKETDLATDTWYDQEQMQNLGPIDLLVVDGPPDSTGKSARYPAIPALFDQLAEGAIILVDDYMRSDEHHMVNDWLDNYALEVVEVLTTEKGTAILRKVKRKTLELED